MDAKAEKIALFRYGLIAPLVLEALPRGELTRRAEEIAARQYEIPGSQRTSISVDTLLDWALRYRNGGFEALAPQPRLDRGKSRTITPQLADCNAPRYSPLTFSRCFPAGFSDSWRLSGLSAAGSALQVG
ncbi:MAG TPA: hypothetical protein VME17_14560 [Bryobacteraceae bacterium]|nr:hypothetical protein [Bryobacteraceae bacterium]